MNTIFVGYKADNTPSMPIKDVKKSIWTGPKKAITAIVSTTVLLAEALLEGIEAKAAFRNDYNR